MKFLNKVLFNLALTLSFVSVSFISNANEDIVYYDDYDLDIVLGLKKDTNSQNETKSTGESLPKDFVAATVRHVSDGDTITVAIANDTYKLRLIGVETPEIVHPSKSVEFFAKEASDYTKAQLTDLKVYLEKDISETDKFNRILRYVWLSLPKDINNPTYEEIRDKMYNGILLRDGYANVSTFPPDVKYYKEFKLIAQEARQAKRGLWNNSAREEFEANLQPIISNPSKQNGLLNDFPNNTSQSTNDGSDKLSPDKSEKFIFPKGSRKIVGQVRNYIKSGKATYEADQTNGPIKGNRKSGIYHLPGQSYYNKISVNNVTWFKDEAEAIRLGYSKANK